MTMITAVRTRLVRIPLERPTSLSNRTLTHRDYPLVQVETEDGETGIGFCYAGGSGGELVTTAIRNLFAPMLIGRDPYQVEGLWQEMYQEALLHGRVGSVMRAISAIDIALWDRNAKAVGLPLWRYLGACADGSVPAYASGGYYLEGDPAAMLAEEFSSYVAQGFTAVKMKVGRLDPGGEEARIRAAREAIGKDVLLMLDANNAFPNLESALRAMAIYERYDPYWIEEPFSPDDIDNHARLARLTAVPVATGEIEAGRWRFKELLEKEAATILQPDAAVCGGITEFRRIAATAASFGISLCPHWFHDLHLHLVASTPNATFVEFFPDDQVLNFRRLIDRQSEVVNGRLLLPDRPGLGFGFVPGKVEEYAVDAWS